MAADVADADAPLKLLSLDGGGIRGIATLIILRYLMKRLNPGGAPPKPCEYFDLIGGTSTGGIIAIMLGRLRMDVETCIDKYIELSSTVFTPKRHKASLRRLGDKWEVDGKYDTERLVKEIRQTVQDNTDDNDPEAKLFDPDPSQSCRVFVCAIATSRSTPVRLRSYSTHDSVDSLAGTGCTIWEAARATSAASTFFDPIQIGRQTFVDGATGMNNPVEQALEEAKSIWPDAMQKGRIQCLVSIGTGVPDLTKFGDNLKQVVETLTRIATETEDTEKRFYNNHKDLGLVGRYFRFNVDRGLADIELDDHEKVAEIEASAEEYLGAPRVKELVDTFLAARAPLIALLDREAKDRCLSWLKVPDPLKQHTDARKQRAPGSKTGRWFLESPLEEWKRTARSFMWLTGKAGSGKTVLSSTVVNELENEPGSVVIFYYFTFRDEATHSVATLKHSLLMQLVRHLVREDSMKKGYFHVPKTFHDLFTKYSHSQYPLEECVDATLVGLLNESKNTFIVVDALDEFPNLTAPSMGNHRRVIGFLEELLRGSHGSTHVLITSRREPGIEAAVRDIAVPKITIPMNTDVIKKDIKAFLVDSLLKDPFKEWPRKLKNMVVKTLVAKSDGVFRWAALQLLALMKEDRPQDVENALKTLPKDLEETYERILTGIENLGSSKATIALSVLKWLAYSQRPMLLSEVSEILVLETKPLASGSAPDDDYTVLFQPENRFPTIWKAREILSGLITVSGIDDQDEVPKNQDGAVSFSHFTVQEYLQSDNVRPSIFRLDKVTGHWYIMRSCLGYIKSYEDLYGYNDSRDCSGLEAETGPDTKVVSTQARLDSESETASDSDSDSDIPEFDSSDSETSDTRPIDYRPFPLLLYAAKYWWMHTAETCNLEGTACSPSAVERLAAAIGDFRGQAFRSTAKAALAMINLAFLEDSEQGSTDIYLSANVMGLQAAVKVAIQFGDPEKRRSLSAIADCMAKYLFDGTGGSRETQEYTFDFENPQALCRVAELGDGVIVQLLLDAGVDINYRPSCGNVMLTALQQAVRTKHKRVVERKANPNPIYRALRAPLSGTLKGYIAAAAHLLDKGANFDLDNVDAICDLSIWLPFEPYLHPLAMMSNKYSWFVGGDWTALHWAVANGRQDTAILLIENGADIFEIDTWARCPFSIAIVNRQETLLRTIVDKNKEVCNSASFHGEWTPLHLAAGLRDLLLLRLFLSQGGWDPSTRNSLGLTVLDMAVIGMDALCEEATKRENNVDMGSAKDSIKLLFSHGCSVDAGEELTDSPLHYAAAFDQTEAAEALVECGASIHAKNKKGWTPLLAAANSGSTATARLMLSKGADVNTVTDDTGFTALTLASADGFVETARMLLEAGADPGLQTDEGKTALDYAILGRAKDVVLLLGGRESDILPSREPELKSEGDDVTSNGDEASDLTTSMKLSGCKLAIYDIFASVLDSPRERED